jgi:anhydro-N-acetylmuramic acid kinase
MDAVDAVLVDFETHPPVLRAAHAEPLPDPLRQELMELCAPGPNEIQRMGQLDVRLGRLFAAAALAVMEKAALSAGQIRAIGSHGQTVRHHPGGGSPFTLQLGDPNVIAELAGITTVADFRRRDIAAGGQGAPLAPGFHAAVFRSPACHRTILNLGGMANVTLLPQAPAQDTGGFDTGPGNVLMDIWANMHLGRPIDGGGAWAASGTVDTILLSAMLADPYFALDPPKSTGREYFNLPWLQRALEHTQPHAPPPDVQATLCELTAASVALAIASYAPRTQEVLVCGGGAHNIWLLSRLQAWLKDCRIASTDDYGIDPDWVEATAFAWLAKQTLEGKPGNVPGVTGARREVPLGGIYR